MLVFVSMCRGDLASASVLAAIARQEIPPYYYVINAFPSFIFLQTVRRKCVVIYIVSCFHYYSQIIEPSLNYVYAKYFLMYTSVKLKKKSLNLKFGSKNN